MVLRPSTVRREHAWHCFHLQDRARGGACGKARVVRHTRASTQLGRRVQVSRLLDEGPFFHGTLADLRVGDYLTAGRPSNYRPEAHLKLR